MYQDNINCEYSVLTLPKKIIIYFILFIAFCGWSSLSLHINPWGGDLLVDITSILLFAYVFANRTKISKEELNSVVSYTLITACLSIIPAVFDWNASILSFFRSISFLYYGLAFYYLLNIWKASPSFIIKTVSLFCVIWVVIEVGQQFTYPVYWFAGRAEDEYLGTLENRMGLWRFYIWGVDFVMLAWSIYYARFLGKSKQVVKYCVILALVFAVGLLCYCSRKHIGAFLLSIFAGIILGKKNNSAVRISLVALGISVLLYTYLNSFLIMSQEATEGQSTGEDFIRMVSLDFFIHDFGTSSLYPFFGTGFGSVSLGNYLSQLKEYYHFYQSDVGIIGYYSQVGLVGVSAIIYYIYVFIRNWKYIDVEYKLFFIMKFMLVVFDFWMMWAVGIVAYGVFLYLLNENIKYNKLKLVE